MKNSIFWEKLSQLNNEQLIDSGFENFKRTVNNKYFNWRIFSIKHSLFKSMFMKFLKHPSYNILHVKFLESGTMNADDRKMNIISKTVYKFYIAMLFIYIKKIDKYGIVEMLEEPQLGNPLKIQYKGKYISQDLCHSIDEYNKIMDNMQLPDKPHIVEIGAGYGRTAFVFLSMIDCDYTIVDIPPAINISKKYLTTLFPDRNIQFMSPDEFKTNSQSYNLCINISSFHEMLPSTVNEYFKYINLKCNCIYFKEWISFHNKDDNVEITIDDYPTKNNWNKIYCQKCDIQLKFFESMYEIKHKS